MAVSRRLRFEVLRRDGHTCRYCGASAPEVKLTVDHVTPVALGGKDEPENLVAACQDCNGGKTSATLDAEMVADIKDDALRWARAREAAMDQWRQRRQHLAADLATFAEVWDGWTYGDDETPVPRDGGWDISVERWMRTGLTIDDLIDLIPAAMQNRPGIGGTGIYIDERWRYYCGVVWRTLDDLETATERILTGDEPIAAVFAIDRKGVAERTPRLCIECDERPELGSCGVCGDCIQNGYGAAAAY